MDWNNVSLDELPALIWRELERGCAELEHPFRTPVFGTADEWAASLRTVVLRGVDPARRLLICHTDLRSQKVRHLRRNPQAQWLFYDPRQKIQLRASGLCTVHRSDDLARKAWEDTPLASRAHYCAMFPPGEMISSPEAAFAPGWKESSPTVEQAEAGWPNFAVIVTTVDSFDWLQLRYEGHRRAGFTWTGERLAANWIAP